MNRLSVSLPLYVYVYNKNEPPLIFRRSCEKVQVSGQNVTCVGFVGSEPTPMARFLRMVHVLA